MGSMQVHHTAHFELLLFLVPLQWVMGKGQGSSMGQLELGAATLLTASIKGRCQNQELPLAAGGTGLSCARSQRLMGLSMCASERAANC